LRGSKEKIVAVIGDGSLTGGMCFEALNQAGHILSDLLVVLNHNEMSIAASVGALSNYLNKIMSLPIYNRIRGEIGQFLTKSAMGEKIAPHLRKLEEVIKGIVVPGIFFEELGFRYFGPFDGHNLDVLIPTFKNILEIEGPKIVHVITKKGKGYRFAEEAPERFHSAGPFDISSGEPASEEKTAGEETFTAVFGRKIAEIAGHHSNVAAVTAAMPLGTGLHIFQRHFPERFFDVGIAEAHAAAFAAGLAGKDFKVFVAIYSTFLQRAYDQVMQNIALPQARAVFVIDRAGVVPADGPTHQGIYDIAYLRTLPDCVIMAPKGKEELEQMLDFSLGCAQPCFIRFPKDIAKSFPVNPSLRFREAELVAEGDDLVIIAAGTTCVQALEVRRRLARENLSVGIINPRFLKPFDEECIIKQAERCRAVVTLEDGIIEGGFGQAVLGFLNRKGLLSKIRVLNLGLPTEFVGIGKREELFKQYGLDAESLSRSIKQFLQQPKTYEQAITPQRR
jgi:1-deoxy-D-xylulose-5-phosphate synthase